MNLCIECGMSEVNQDSEFCSEYCEGRYADFMDYLRFAQMEEDE